MGVQHYVKLVDDLLEAGIQPMVTLYQWDLPETLQQRYGGLLNKTEFVADFANYARTMFRALGKVKIWMTFTEPWIVSAFGYNRGVFAPGRCSDRSKAPEGDSSRECWIVGHNILLAHASAVKIFREEFKPTGGGEIGITLNSKLDQLLTVNYGLTDFARRLGVSLRREGSPGSGSSPPSPRLLPRLVCRSHLPWLLPGINEEATERSSP